MAALNYLVPLSLIVVVLLAIVTTSYRQTLFAYPNGGGSYIVSRENLGVTPALVAGASLLVDYVLTVAVSVSAGVAAITSAFPATADIRVPMCIFFVALMTVGNLRGVKESGRLFAGPTYIYVFALSRADHRRALPVVLRRPRRAAGQPGGARTRSRENGVVAHRRHLFASAARLLVRCGRALGRRGDLERRARVPQSPSRRTRPARSCGWRRSSAPRSSASRCWRTACSPTVSENETLLSIMGKAVFGDGTIFYYVLQFSTFAILILAANTAYADFPRLSSIIARDGFLPRQLANRGDRLVFSNGVLVLAGVATLLIVVFGGKTSALIPLYAVGVFTGFTLSQTGMVIHHHTLREPRWRSKLAVNAVGAVATGIVLIVVVVSKFTIGAWIPVVLIPIIVTGPEGDRSPLQARRGARPRSSPSGSRAGTPTTSSCSSGG